MPPLLPVTPILSKSIKPTTNVDHRFGILPFFADAGDCAIG